MEIVTRLPSDERTGHAESPVSEEIGSLSREPFYELARKRCTTLKALELTLRPSHERLIDVSQQGKQRRRSIASVIFNPASEEGIELPGDVL